MHRQDKCQGKEKLKLDQTHKWNWYYTGFIVDFARTGQRDQIYHVGSFPGDGISQAISGAGGVRRV
jgi:hypothetical protein